MLSERRRIVSGPKNRMRGEFGLNRSTLSASRVKHWSSQSQFRRKHPPMKIDIESPKSFLVNTNLKTVINERTFSLLPPSAQRQLITLLPRCDQIMSPVDGYSLTCSAEALNNEFFTKSCVEWSDRLSQGEFIAENQLMMKTEEQKEEDKVDEWKLRHFETNWGDSQPCPAADSSPDVFHSNQLSHCDAEWMSNRPVAETLSQQLQVTQRIYLCDPILESVTLDHAYVQRDTSLPPEGVVARLSVLTPVEQPHTELTLVTKQETAAGADQLTHQQQSPKQLLQTVTRPLKHLPHYNVIQTKECSVLLKKLSSKLSHRKVSRNWKGRFCRHEHVQNSQDTSSPRVSIATDNSNNCTLPADTSLNLLASVSSLTTSSSDDPQTVSSSPVVHADDTVMPDVCNNTQRQVKVYCIRQKVPNGLSSSSPPFELMQIVREFVSSGRREPQCGVIRRNGDTAPSAEVIKQIHSVVAGSCKRRSEEDACTSLLVLHGLTSV